MKILPTRLRLGSSDNRTKGGVGTKEAYYTPGLADYKGAHIVAAGGAARATMRNAHNPVPA